MVSEHIHEDVDIASLKWTPPKGLPRPERITIGLERRFLVLFFFSSMKTFARLLANSIDSQKKLQVLSVVDRFPVILRIVGFGHTAKSDSCLAIRDP